MAMYNNTKTNSIILFFILLVSVVIAYIPSFSVPYYFDDYLHIKDNPLMLEGNLSDVFKQQRAVGVFSFWLNFKFKLSSLFELHLTNLIIHTLNCFLVFAFIKSLFTTTALKTQSLNISIQQFAFIGAVLFALHPLNTQAVTYLIQRFASLVLFFYLAAIIFYIYSRNSVSLNKKVAYFVLFIISFLLALNTKQNAVTLVLVLCCIELVFYKSITVRKFILAILSISILSVFLFIASPEQFALLDSLTTETTRFTRLEYFFTQLTVILVYIYKFFVPTPLLLEYDLSPDTYSTLITVFSGLIIISACIFAWKIRNRSPLVLFGLLFYLSAHSVESSFIPINDMMVEHRTYIPNIGLIIALLGLLYTSSIPNKVVTYSIIAFCIILGFLTFQRNTVWQNPTSFYSNEYEHNPNHARVSGNLAKALLESGEIEKGIDQLNKTLEIADGAIDDELAVNLVAAAIEVGDYERAEKISEIVLPGLKSSKIRATLLNNLGVLYLRLGKLEEAEKHLIRSLKQKQYLPQSHYAIGVVYFEQKKYGNSYAHIERLLQLQPSHKDGKRLRNLLINIYRKSRKNAKNDIHDGR